MRDDRASIWQQNVEKLKAGKGNESTENGVSVNKDWPLTKAKKAQLYSQTPEIRLTPREDIFAQIVPIFSKQLNDLVEEANVGATIDEELSDAINPSGIAGCITSCEARTELKLDPVTGMEAPVPVDRQYLVDRISPTDLLIPTDFTGSDYDKARWLGHEGRMTWVEAMRIFGLTEDQKEDVLGRDRRANQANKTLNTDTNKFRDTEVVNYQQVFYWRHYYHPEETRFKALQRIVFVDGLEEPVANEEYTGQRRLEDGTIVGVLRNPIQILTLTYVSDEALPPSDSTIARAQVDELEQIRDLQIQQRKHSIPWRWADGNRVSPNQKALLEKGPVQGVIITNGPGDRAVGEVARASYPPEDFEFERLADQSLSEIYQVGTNQAGSFSKSDRSASEARIIQQNFQTRVGQERDKVTKHFVRICEVLAGHLALYGNIPLPAGIPQESIANGFVYSVRADSSVRLDAEQRIEQITRALNLTAQSGYVNPKEPIAEIWELSGFNPEKVVIDPQPKAPEPVKMSVNNAVDLRDPFFIAYTMATGQAPTPEQVSAAIKLSQALEVMMPPPIDQTAPVDGGPPRDPETPGITNPSWEAAPRIERRSEDGGA